MKKLILTLLMFSIPLIGWATTYEITTPGNNVGIGSTNPAQALDVSGTVRAQTFTGTSSNPSSFVGNVGVGNASPSQALDVTGTVKAQTFTGTSSNPSSFVGNVGVGSTSPTQALDVSGTVKATAFSGNGAGQLNIATNQGIGIDPINQTFTTAVLSLPTTGNVGIGSSTPGQKLDVQGTVRALHFSGEGSLLTGITSSQWTTINTNDVYLPNTGNVGIGTTATTTASFTVLKNGSTDYMQINSSAGGAGNALIIKNGGNVGINKTAPGQQLDVGGTVNAVAFISTGSGITNFAGGNVGINSATPGQLLDVVGTVRAQTFTGTSSNPSSFFGNVGVGSTVPGAKLDVNGTLTAGDIMDVRGTLRTFSVVNNGNVGVGVANPVMNLDVQGSVRAGDFIATTLSTGTIVCNLNGVFGHCSASAVCTSTCTCTCVTP